MGGAGPCDRARLIKGRGMQAKYSREWGEKQQRSMTLKLTHEDLEGLPETLAQEFRRAEHTQRPAQLLSVWARILGLQPADAQLDMFTGAESSQNGHAPEDTDA
jgi:hypothetical protein